MGRSPKIGLDYFRLDVHLDDKFKMIEAEFGLKGFAVVVKLYQKIYGEQGYYCEWNDDVALVFGKEIGLQPGANAVSEIVTASIKRRLFDKGMFDKYHILTSNGIQERYFEAVERRERVEVIQEYLLVSCDKLPKNVNIKRISVDRKSVSDSRKAHSRGEQSRVEESIGDSNSSSGSSDITTTPENPFGDTADCRRPTFDTVEAYASANIPNMTIQNLREFQTFQEDLPDELIRHAIDEACGSGHAFYNYVRSILNRYVDGHFKTMADVNKYEKERRKRSGRRGADSSDAPGAYKGLPGETVV